MWSRLVVNVVALIQHVRDPAAAAAAAAAVRRAHERARRVEVGLGEADGHLGQPLHAEVEERHALAARPRRRRAAAAAAHVRRRRRGLALLQGRSRVVGLSVVADANDALGLRETRLGAEGRRSLI